jgi:hypothetical protein
MVVLPLSEGTTILIIATCALQGAFCVQTSTLRRRDGGGLNVQPPACCPASQALRLLGTWPAFNGGDNCSRSPYDSGQKREQGNPVFTPHSPSNFRPHIVQLENLGSPSLIQAAQIICAVERKSLRVRGVELGLTWDYFAPPVVVSMSRQRHDVRLPPRLSSPVVMPFHVVSWLT